jgi:hypothetical protein
MNVVRTIAAAGAALFATLACQGAWAACYLVYSADQQVVYRSQVPPVDMSLNLHETLPQIAPGGALVFSLGNEGCEVEMNRLPAISKAKQAGKTARRQPAHKPADAQG